MQLEETFLWRIGFSYTQVQLPVTSPLCQIVSEHPLGCAPHGILPLIAVPFLTLSTHAQPQTQQQHVEPPQAQPQTQPQPQKQQQQQHVQVEPQQQRRKPVRGQRQGRSKQGQQQQGEEGEEESEWEEWVEESPEEATAPPQPSPPSSAPAAPAPASTTPSAPPAAAPTPMASVLSEILRQQEALRLQLAALDKVAQELMASSACNQQCCVATVAALYKVACEFIAPPACMPQLHCSLLLSSCAINVALLDKSTRKLVALLACTQQVASITLLLHLSLMHAACPGLRRLLCLALLLHSCLLKCAWGHLLLTLAGGICRQHNIRHLCAGMGQAYSDVESAE
eukprot:scaffold90513_cov16-Tisochrysis_lutea.AAC.1